MTLIPLDYRSEAALSRMQELWRVVRPGWEWPPRHPYAAEYSWAVDRLLHHLRCPPALARVMDAGGGRGALQHWLAEACLECWNVDTRPKHLHAAACPSLLLTSDLELADCALPPASFDAVVSASALEHNSPGKFLRVVEALLRLLRPGAPLVATVPAFEWETYYPEGGWPPPHESWPECILFDRETLARISADVAGLAVMVEPATLPPAEEYRAAWRDQHADMMENSPERSRYPYLSMGFVLVRR